MNEENVFMQSEMEMRPPPHANNCHGHKTSIAAGGNGHWSGDGCGCDTLNPSVSIDGYLWVLVAELHGSIYKGAYEGYLTTNLPTDRIRIEP